MPRHFRRLVGVLSVLAALATFAAVPAGAAAKGPTTVNFTQNTGTVTVTWDGGYDYPKFALYPEDTACPGTLPPGQVPAAPISSVFDLTINGSVIVSLSTMVIPGWNGFPSAPLTGGTYNFCMYNIVGSIFNPVPIFNLVNTSGWVGTVSAGGPPGSSDPSLPAPPGSPAPPGEDDPSSATSAPQPVTPSFTG